MEIINLGNQDSVFNHFVREIRDISIQKDAMRFRRNIERIGEIFAYEISKKMNYQAKEIRTPLGISTENIMLEKPVLATILRAGLPLHQGLLNYFDNSDNCFISAYRKHKKGGNFEIKIEYMSSPDLEGKTVILCDPMLASGNSMVLAIEALLSKGKPKHIHVVVAIASSEGIQYFKENTPFRSCTLWLGAEDQEMTSQSYIVPGLGDAGDLAFGEKS
ncbi:uracil phosphoribosyltransferase [Flavobacteriales bacterium]|jgi:uracil phosphoribosyltransferase|nr:uracil phosphoribosyltransferase [Flavobacteriales bacterium]MDC3305622.1 uracil phosphoribosyltransferase [Flavobacteriales bacterium]MDG1348448.1 uracil phosphoribosyltransferase [Flavobacteriales bacterium]|tara:strand:+ start:358 stop:1011 length:654 start_codon:yes stop_codon:yes gene_type:complete